MTVHVDVVLDGRLVLGSHDAVMRHGVVVAPLDPYVRDLATSIATDIGNGHIAIARGGRRIVIALGSRQALGTTATTLPIAPYLRAGEPIIPLAAVARALGATVAFDPRTRTLALGVPVAPVGTPTPFAGYVAPTGPLPTFEPTATPAPAATVTGLPLPRRTPILIEPDPP